MGRICSFVSVKGGTGKTTTCVNTGIALANEGFAVLVIDANLEGSNLSFHLGLSTNDIATIHDVIRGRCSAKDAIYTHPSGMNIMLGSSFLDDIELRDSDLSRVINELKKGFDYIIMDCSSGLSGSVKSVIKHSDEVVIVTNPELPAVVDAFKVIQYCERNTAFIKGVIVNRAAKNSDLSKSDVEMILSRPVIGVIPEDDEIKNAMRERTPIVAYKPRRKSARIFRNVAFKIGGLGKSEPVSFWDWLLRSFN